MQVGKKAINLYYSSTKVIAYCILHMDYMFELPIQNKGLKLMCVYQCTGLVLSALFISTKQAYSDQTQEEGN